jgi:hypothetical protein
MLSSNTLFLSINSNPVWVETSPKIIIKSPNEEEIGIISPSLSLSLSLPLSLFFSVLPLLPTCLLLADIIDTDVTIQLSIESSDQEFAVAVVPFSMPVFETAILFVELVVRLR